LHRLKNEDVYVNRKRYHSINVQVVFSADYRIVDIVAKWPGAGCQDTRGERPEAFELVRGQCLSL